MKKEKEMKSKFPVGTLTKVLIQSVVITLLISALAQGEVSIDVLFKAQVLPGEWEETQNCGQTSALMVFCYYKSTTPTVQGIKDIDDWLYEKYDDPVNNYNGSMTNRHKLKVLSCEYEGFPGSYTENGWYLQDIKEEIDEDCPVIVAVGGVLEGKYWENGEWHNIERDYSVNGHWLVVKGYSDTHIICNDPGTTHGHNVYYSNDSFSSAMFEWDPGYSDWEGAVVIVGPYLGSGTEEDPYIITNVYQLQEMNNDLTAWYELGNDIDASDTINWNDGKGFAPVGEQYSTFGGHFDGKGHVITGLYINRPGTDDAGLFGNTGVGSEIKSVGLVDVVIIGRRANGGLVGFNHGTIDCCYSTGTVESIRYHAGGLVGTNCGTVSNSYSTANAKSGPGIPGGSAAGGLLGLNSGSGTVYRCYSTGVPSGEQWKGGLIGYAHAGTECLDGFWDIETSEQTTSAGGTGKTTAEMKQEATFTNWDFINIWDIDESVVYPFLICFNEVLIAALSPVDLIVTDPDGLEISKQLNEIPGATYLEYDIDEDGELDDIVTVPKKLGDYLTQVVPEPNALPTDTYSLEATIENQTMVLAEDVQIQDIPEEPYEVESKLCYSDFDDSNNVDFVDYAILGSHWFEQDCNYPAWCEGTDLDYSGSVDINDLAIFTEHWLWPDSGMEDGEGPGGPSDPGCSENPNIIIRVVDINDCNEITIDDVNETITVYVRMTTVNDVNVYIFDVEIDISDVNLGFIDNTAHPNGTAEILATPRNEGFDYWGPGIEQEQGIELFGASIGSSISDGNLASFQYTSNGEGDVTLTLIDLASNVTCEDIVIHQVDPNSQQAGGEGMSMPFWMEVQQSQPIQEIDINKLVSLLEEIWLEDDGIREMVSEDEWNEFIDSVKNSPAY